MITGFLGSGKTTFIKKYAAWLMSQGQNIGILENDFGAVNVDMMLLHDLEGENCELEMVSGGCDADLSLIHICCQKELMLPGWHRILIMVLVQEQRWQMSLPVEDLMILQIRYSMF